MPKTRTPLETSIATCVSQPFSRDGVYGGHLWLVVLAFVAVACCGPWLDTASACPDPDDETIRGYPYDPQGEEITVKFVFVTFPGSDQTELRESTHERFPEKFAEYFTEISGGKLTFSTDTGILFKYVNNELDNFDQFPTDSTAVAWMAELAADHYDNEPGGSPEHTLPESYLQEWEGRVGSWWVTDAYGQPTPNFATELTAEILWIYGFFVIPELVPADADMLIKSMGAETERVPVIEPFLSAGPNPFNPATEIRFAIGTRSRVTLDVFDLRGRRVHRLVDESLDPGIHQATWRGTDIDGSGVASGVYLIRLQGGGITLKRAVTVIK